MGNILRQQGKSAEARSAYSEAVEIRKGSGDATTVAEAQLALVELSLDDGDSKVAVALLGEASPALHQANLADDEVLTKALLSDALLSQGDWAAAETEIKSGLVLRNPNQKHGNQVHDVNVRFAIAENRLLAFTKPVDAIAALKHLLADAVRTKYLNQQFEIRLTTAQIELTFSDKVSARSHLAQLAKDARANGFILIANKATHASSAPV
jgi:tetratricopeptide (TPR) repeat protein